MTEFLTAKEMEELLHVDRSTIYRMAEQGRLPAVKVGKQWRFPSDQVSSQFHIQMPDPSADSSIKDGPLRDSDTNQLVDLLPLECVELIQDSFASLLGVMLVVTNMEGEPITRPSNSCGLFNSVSQEPAAMRKCIQSWQMMATSLELEPHFYTSHLGLLCARALIRVGSALKGMVVAGCVSPDVWPPDGEVLDDIAVELEVNRSLIEERVDEVHRLSHPQKDRVLLYTQRMANIIAHIVNERSTLVTRLEAIANLTTL